MIAILYYLTVFYIVFKNNQFNMLKHTAISFILSFGLSIILCGMFVTFQIFALKGNCKFLFYVFAFLKSKL